MALPSVTSVLSVGVFLLQGRNYDLSEQTPYSLLAAWLGESQLISVFSLLTYEM